MSEADRTLDLLRQLVDSRPADWAARAHLAGLLLEAGRGREALALLDAAPERPTSVEASLLLGRTLAAVDPARAISHYLALVAADRRCAPAHLALARLYRERGLKEDARHHYGIAVVLDAALEDPAFDDWIHGTRSVPAPLPAEVSSPVVPATPPAAVEVPSAQELEDALDLPGRAGAAQPRITFADVGGMEDLKEQIRMRVVYPFKNPEVFQKFQKRPGGGILLYGPPGCGKTYLARATAGECQARFLTVGIAEILSRWLGESEQRLAQVFESARRRPPSVLFIDELGALGMDRREARGSALQTTINQLLTELDGVGSNNASVLVLAATNSPWNVDSAFRRPGRFDRVVFVPPPDATARAEILRLHLKDVPHEEVDLARFAGKTRNFSGADLRHVVELAGEAAIREELRLARPSRITEKMLWKAVQETKPSTLEWLDTARRYASYSNRSGQYDDVAKFFESDAG